MHKIIFSKRSKQDLKEIMGFIALDSKYFSIKVIETIIMFIDHSLSYFPHLWKKFDNWNLREITEPTFKYTIIYRYSNNLIEIVSIFKYRNNV